MNFCVGSEVASKNFPCRSKNGALPHGRRTGRGAGDPNSPGQRVESVDLLYPSPSAFGTGWGWEIVKVGVFFTVTPTMNIQPNLDPSEKYICSGVKNASVAWSNFHRQLQMMFGDSSGLVREIVVVYAMSLC